MFYPQPGHPVHAHQWAYEQVHGPIPMNPKTGKKYPVDHLCHNEAAERGECAGGPTCPHRRCQNLAHLGVTTSRGNVLASPLTVTAQNAAKTHCPAGHPYDGANTYIWRGRRGCRACHREAARKRRSR